MSGQTTLFDMDMLTNTKAKAVGTYGESLAREALERVGYIVSNTHAREHRGDLRIVDQTTGEILRIEVKTSRRGRSGSYQFCLKREGRYLYTSVAHADVLLLLAITRAGEPIPFVIPVADLPPIKQIVIHSDPRDYAGKYAAYRQTMNQLNLNQSKTNKRSSYDG